MKEIGGLFPLRDSPTNIHLAAAHVQVNAARHHNFCIAGDRSRGHAPVVDEHTVTRLRHLGEMRENKSHGRIMPDRNNARSPQSLNSACRARMRLGLKATRAVHWLLSRTRLRLETMKSSAFISPFGTASVFWIACHVAHRCFTSAAEFVEQHHSGSITMINK